MSYDSTESIEYKRLEFLCPVCMNAVEVEYERLDDEDVYFCPVCSAAIEFLIRAFED